MADSITLYHQRDKIRASELWISSKMGDVFYPLAISAASDSVIDQIHNKQHILI